jgi:cytochrome c-type biogenesis protein CcmH/NrfG
MSANCKFVSSKLIPALDLLPSLGNNSWRSMPEKNTAKNKKMSRQELRDLEVKITFMEGIVRRDPRYVEALQILGDHYTQRGRFDHSLKVDKRLSRLEPQNPLVFYNLACSYSLNSEFDMAAGALERAISLGYRDFKWLARDPDLRRLRQHPIYRGIEDKIRRMKVKIA